MGGGDKEVFTVHSSSTVFSIKCTSAGLHVQYHVNSTVLCLPGTEGFEPPPPPSGGSTKLGNVLSLRSGIITGKECHA